MVPHVAVVPTTLGVVCVVLALYYPQALLPLGVTIGLPLVLYGIISLLELVIMGKKHGSMQHYHQQRRHEQQVGVLHRSRALCEHLDGDMLQLFMRNRDLNDNDYERLMRLQEMNRRRRREGATLQQIQQLPIVTVTQNMLQASANANCTVCLNALEVGDRLRLMPCFDRFHPDCIDPWLQEKGWCPICKCPAIM